MPGLMTQLTPPARPPTHRRQGPLQVRRPPPQLPVNHRSSLGVNRSQLLNRRDGNRPHMLNCLGLSHPLAAGGAGCAAVQLAPPAASDRAAVPRIRHACALRSSRPRPSTRLPQHVRHRPYPCPGPLPHPLPPHCHHHHHRCRRRQRPHAASLRLPRHSRHTDTCTWECHHVALLTVGRLQGQRRVRRGARRGLGVGGLAGGGGGLHRVRLQLRPLRRLWVRLRPGLAVLHCCAGRLLRPLWGLLGGKRPTRTAHDVRWGPSCL